MWGYGDTKYPHPTRIPNSQQKEKGSLQVPLSGEHVTKHVRKHTGGDEMRKYRKFWIDDSDEGDTRIFLDNIRTELWSIDDAKDEIDCWWVANDPQRLL